MKPASRADRERLVERALGGEGADVDPPAERLGADAARAVAEAAEELGDAASSPMPVTMPRCTGVGRIAGAAVARSRNGAQPLPPAPAARRGRRDWSGSRCARSGTGRPRQRRGGTDRRRPRRTASLRVEPRGGVVVAGRAPAQTAGSRRRRRGRAAPAAASSSKARGPRRAHQKSRRVGRGEAGRERERRRARRARPAVAKGPR